MTDYTVQDLSGDIMNVLTTRPNNNGLSGIALGNNDNKRLWDDEHLKKLYDGIVKSQNIFFPQIPLQSFARLILCECAQESTGNYNLTVVPVDLSDFKSQGIIQLTPGSVLKDYMNHGIQFDDSLIPSEVTKWDLSDPEIQILIWSWYTYNSVLAGVSLEEYCNRIAWNTQRLYEVTRDYGNLQLCWLAGPRNDRHTNAKNNYQDYYNRICDYWVGSTFGTRSDFDNLIDTKLNGDIKFVK